MFNKNKNGWRGGSRQSRQVERSRQASKKGRRSPARRARRGLFIDISLPYLGRARKKGAVRTVRTVEAFPQGDRGPATVVRVSLPSA